MADRYFLVRQEFITNSINMCNKWNTIRFLTVRLLTKIYILHHKYSVSTDTLKAYKTDVLISISIIIILYRHLTQTY